MRRIVYTSIYTSIVLSILLFPASAFTIETAQINIGYIDANVDFTYSLNWWEQIIYGNFASISGGEIKLIESKFSDLYGKKVQVRTIDAQNNKVTFYMPDFIDLTKDFSDGRWINYTGLSTTKYSIKDVIVIYPDGTIKTHYGKIPSDVHFVNNNLARYNYRAQYYQNLYGESYESYDPNTYNLYSILDIVGEMLTRTGYYDFLIKTGAKSIAISGFPDYVQWIGSLKGSIETITTGEPYKSLANLKNDKTLLGNVMSDSGFVGYMGDGLGESGRVRNKISVDMKTLSELKAQEVLLLERLTSETKEWDATLDSLVANLQEQKSTLLKLNEASKTMVKDVKNDKDFGVALSDDSFVYLESISGLAEQISENDLVNVNEELEYLTKL